MKFKLYLFVLIFFGMLFVFAMWTDTFNNFSVSDLYSFKSSGGYKSVPGMKYVLQWTSSRTEPFVFMKKGQEVFINSNCSVNNCYITEDRYLLNDITAFDAILFHAPEIVFGTIKVPIRSVNQKYFFVSMESSANYPVSNNRYDGFFNSTWTYKLDSDVYYGYLIVRNRTGEIIGPSTSIPWISVDDMLPISDNVKEKLANKTVAVAWFVSNCQAKSKRLKFGKEVEQELKKYNLSLHIYGDCSSRKCPRDSMDKCLQMLQRDYYFYFSFENSFSEDYVTEKLVRPLQNYVVPVVFGGADYSRFMPDGIYLNALELGPRQLAKKMFDIISDKEQYYSYFKWMNHYSFHDVRGGPDSDCYCKFCEKLNDETWMNKTTVINNFREWWNPQKNNWLWPIV